mmetsp:Transcript_32302/g.74921  ORF Transcript_32302/g.74921 Transcript_32302/m.74921 type:complete len:311 (-) Transcript_32302:1703-2635(-)
MLPVCRGAALGATAGLLAGGAGCCLAAAIARSCMRRNVFGTPLPFSTSVGSKSGCTPSTAPTALAIWLKRARRASRSSGQSSSTSAGKPVAALTASVTSKMNLGGGLARRSAADFLDLAQRPSQRMIWPNTASVLSGVSSASVGTYSWSGFEGMPAGRAARVGSARTPCNASQLRFASSAAGPLPPPFKHELDECSTTSHVWPMSTAASCSSSSVFSCTCFCTKDSILLTSSIADLFAFPALPSAETPSESLASSASSVRVCWNFSNSELACRTASDNSEAVARLEPSSCANFSPPFRNLSSLGMQRLSP